MSEGTNDSIGIICDNPTCKEHVTQAEFDAAMVDWIKQGFFEDIFDNGEVAYRITDKGRKFFSG